MNPVNHDWGDGSVRITIIDNRIYLGVSSLENRRNFYTSIKKSRLSLPFVTRPSFPFSIPFYNIYFIYVVQTLLCPIEYCVSNRLISPIIK